MDENKNLEQVILWVGSYSSQCGACRGNADPREETHTRPIGYTPRPGCGARYTHVASVYISVGSEEAVRQMRPDLVFVGRAPSVTS